MNMLCSSPKLALRTSWISVSHSGHPTRSLKCITRQQPSHFLLSASLAIASSGLLAAFCAAAVTDSVITSSSVASPSTFWSIPRTRAGKSIVSHAVYLTSPHFATASVSADSGAVGAPKAMASASCASRKAMRACEGGGGVV